MRQTVSPALPGADETMRRMTRRGQSLSADAGCDIPFVAAPSITISATMARAISILHPATACLLLDFQQLSGALAMDLAAPVWWKYRSIQVSNFSTMSHAARANQKICK